MAEVTRFHNLHNVYVKTGLATKEQLDISVQNFKNELNRMFPGKNYDKCEILINLVTIRNQSMKYAYLWVENPEVYYIICGFNPDGSERIEEFIETQDSKTDEEDDLDLDLSLDLNDIIKQKQDKEPIKIVKQLGPILTLPPYEYTQEQINIIYDELTNEETKLASTEGRSPNPVEKPKYGFFECSRSDTTSIEEGMSFNILWGKVPNWVNENMVASIFGRYAENMDPKNLKIKFGNPCKDPYLVNHKEITIDFCNSKVRGLATFALQMTRKTRFVKPDTKEEVECIFNYFRKKSFNNDNNNHHNHHNNHNNNYNDKPKIKKNTEFLNRGLESSTFFNRVKK